MEDRQLLSDYLKQLRKSHYYKQEDIASRLRISRQTYSHYETGRIQPSVKILYKLAQIYGISRDSFFEHMDNGIFRRGGGSGISTEEQLQEYIGQEMEDFTSKEFRSCFCGLNERHKREVLSIMWEIMQAKKSTEEREAQ